LYSPRCMCSRLMKLENSIDHFLVRGRSGQFHRWPIICFWFTEQSAKTRVDTKRYAAIVTIPCATHSTRVTVASQMWVQLVSLIIGHPLSAVDDVRRCRSSLRAMSALAVRGRIGTRERRSVVDMISCVALRLLRRSNLVRVGER
jgi:hypothetical protein